MGLKNHGLFLMFLMTTWSSLILGIILCALKMTSFELPSEREVWIAYVPHFLPDEAYNIIALYVIKGLVIGLGFLFLCPLSLLCLVQLRNFCLAKTTSERYSRRP